MKTRKYILFALAVLGLATSCQDRDWSTPSQEETIGAFGNKYIQATNVKTIAELKALYSNEINNNSLKEVKTPLQIVGVVTGNDAGGNIYNSLYIQDNTGAIAISVGQGGLSGPFAVGQAVMVELEGLYIGGYGKQAQIGTTYTNPKKEGATPQVGRMSRFMWQEHYRLLLPNDPLAAGMSAAPIEVKWNFNTLNIADDCAKLITLKGVTLAEADGTAVFAPSDGSVTLTANCANRVISGLTNVVLRTSTYADFANKAMPTERVDITGVATRYNDTWQLLMRSEADIVKSDTEAPPTSQPTGTGTQADPYNVAAVTQYTKSLASDAQSPSDVYTKGVIVSVSDIDTSGNFGNATYLISDYADGVTGTFQIYRGFGLNGEKFNKAGAKLINPGDTVIVKGKVVNYKGNTPQYAQGSTIVKLNNEGGGGTTTGEAEGTGTQADPFNVAAAIAKCQEAGETATNDIFYVKGIVNAEYTVDSYKNATLVLVDTEGSDAKFTAFRVKGADGANLKEGYKIPKNATVIVSGKLVNYKGNTPETAQNSGTLISVNGQAPELDGDSGGGGGGDTPSGDGVSKAIDGSTLTLTNTTVKASSTTVSVDFSAQGWTNGEAATTVNLSDGTAITFIQGDATNPPKYYDATKGVRFYATNGMTITASSKAIAKVVLNCDSYNGTNYVGNDMLYGSASGTSMTIINNHTSASGGVQLRVKTMEITYAE